MKTVLIADDDYIARSKIRGVVSWEEYGYTIVGEASNGKEALELIERTMPKIVLVDMDMPVMNGVELIREIKIRRYSVAIIVLSSYNDFDYVRDSMKLGALDYILKSELNASQLLKTLSYVEDSKDDGQVKKLSQQDHAYIRELYVKKILLGITREDEDSREWIACYGLPIDKYRNMLAVCEVDDYYQAVEKMDEKGVFAFNQFIENLFKEAVHKQSGMIAVKIKEKQYCIILSCKEIYSVYDAQQALECVLREIGRNLLRFLNMTVSISISPICLGLDELSNYYKKAGQRLKNKFYLGKNGIFREQEAANADQETENVYYIKQEKEILFLLSVGDREGLANAVKEVFRKLESNRVDENQAKQTAAEILGCIYTAAKQKGADLNNLCKLEEPFQKVNQYETLHDLESWLLGICGDLCEFISGGREKYGYNRLTVRAMEYIKKHYTQPISLSDTAQFLEVSSSHLSRVFKGDTGMNFINYLNQMRIDKAKHMLDESSSRQMKSIAYETGFNNYNHFFLTFKNIVGMSPNEYQDRLKIK